MTILGLAESFKTTKPVILNDIKYTFNKVIITCYITKTYKNK